MIDRYKTTFIASVKDKSGSWSLCAIVLCYSEMKTTMLKTVVVLLLINVVMSTNRWRPRRGLCTGPPDSGPCYANMRRFYHVAGVCVPFTYGGCAGNANNHESWIGCMQTCVFRGPIGRRY
ncbi:Protease inhibitor bitisilin-1 [Mizuhopecten yessoensis]|uniref:Protease inhibitor bitisilin-1 n=2 Tax=Mizuhopecten yessoensis TaxID=6573 RepID=A0A210R5T4_MIZYE|nr:Protease inhibitor bitisilin-1 [Mizuhopecten yessoensis]